MATRSSLCIVLKAELVEGLGSGNMEAQSLSFVFDLGPSHCPRARHDSRRGKKGQREAERREIFPVTGGAFKLL